MILTSSSLKLHAKSVRKSFQTIDCNNIISDDDLAIKMYSTQQNKSFIILDFGAESASGYPIFTVKSISKTANLRVCYSDRYGIFELEKGKKEGDFSRGDCKYLGVELPVLPANPSRYELYTVDHSGEYIFPLIQGQQRFVYITLESDDCEIQISRFYFYYTADTSVLQGSFECDDSNLTKLWYCSSNTVQIATITSKQWDVVNGKFLLRALTKGNKCAINKSFTNQKNYALKIKFSISKNQNMVSGIGFAVRAIDENHCYVINIDLDGKIRCYLFSNNVFTTLLCETSIDALIDNHVYDAIIIAKDSNFTLLLNNKQVAQFEDSAFACGSWGFCQTTEKWAVVHMLEMYDLSGNILYNEQFKTLENYTIYSSKPFIADGAKRDRLIWSGDLHWSGKNAYYCLGSACAMKNTIDMMLNHQTPEGYLWATFYPEDTCEKRNGEWGYYESDLFSAWHAIVYFNHFLYTGDKEFALSKYQIIKKSLYYLWQYVENDGLFNQRYETSKGLWDHVLGDKGKHAYNNIIVYTAMLYFSKVASGLNNTQDEAIFSSFAQKMHDGIIKNLYNQQDGYFVKSINNNEFCFMANSAALAFEIVNNSQAALIAQNMIKNDVSHGKILVMAIKGLYNYNQDELAFNYLTSKNYFKNDWGYTGSVCWYDVCTQEDAPQTTTECMFLPPICSENVSSWGDLSHPDTAICDILSGDILGIKPSNIGFSEFLIQPHLHKIKWASGQVPTPHGNIIVKLSKENGLVAMQIQVPQQTTGKIVESGVILKPGIHRVVFCKE